MSPKLCHECGGDNATYSTCKDQKVSHQTEHPLATKKIELVDGSSARSRAGLVSVVIPTHNCGNYIVQAVESVLSQTYASVECIVVDDGSTDDTSTMLFRYLDRIVYITQMRQGRSVARNRGIAVASGEYVAFLDADDWWDATKIERQVELLVRFPEVAIAYCWMIHVDEFGESIGVWSDGRRTGVYSHTVMLQQLLSGNIIPGPASTMLLRSSAIDKHGAFDPDCPATEDWEYCLRVALFSDFACIGEPLAFYRHATSSSFGIGHFKKFELRKRLSGHIYALDKMTALIGANCEIVNQIVRAYAQKYWQGALVSYGVQDVEMGRRRAMQAFTHCQAFFETSLPDVPNWEHEVLSICRYFGYSEHSGYQDLSSIVEYLDFLFDNLPYPLAHLTSRKNAICAQVFAANAFIAVANGDLDRVRRCGIQAILRDTRLLGNFGLLKATFLAHFRIGVFRHDS